MLSTGNAKSLYINREISWLDFNERVLEEAMNKKHPLLERLRFLSISGSNLDEFYMVRVAGLVAQIDQGINIKSIDDMTAKQQLIKVQNKVKKIFLKQNRYYKKLFLELKKEKIYLKDKNKLTIKQNKYIYDYFQNQILPLLTPLAIDPAHPFPFVSNLGLVLALEIRHKQTNKKRNALLPFPANMEKFIELSPNSKNKKIDFIAIQDVIIKYISEIFKGYDYINGGLFRIIRDSDIEFQEEAEDLLMSFKSQLRIRKRGKVVLLLMDKNMPLNLRKLICRDLDVDEDKIIRSNGMYDFQSVAEIVNKGPIHLKFKKYMPRFPERIKQENNDIFRAIRKKDIIVHHPYETFDVVASFLEQAAKDPNVTTIKQTLYRTTLEDSPIVRALISASESGKNVTAIVELKARFDEEVNIKLSQDLERAGVHVVYGIPELKTHAKVSLVVRKERSKVKKYVHYGTGNYHPKTAKLYTDLSLFTCEEGLSEDALNFFNVVTGYTDTVSWNKISVAPIGLRKKLIENIEHEIENAKKGIDAGIWFKCNSLVDEELINSLYKASKYGVKIILIIRGICCLRAGVIGLSENIIVKSIIGRYLEHSRIYCFANGKAMPNAVNKVFISSADLMPRNFDRRIEILIPILNNTVHKQVLFQIMFMNVQDNVLSWQMDKYGDYYKKKDDNKLDSAHVYFMKNPSLSGRGENYVKKNIKKFFFG
jgi:polyphosphate kinase|tara:strand:- start:4374 stop:6497 length:2124 start_codon:yes stop_codon:yes gene_type:complete